MANKKETKLEPTYGNFELKGIIKMIEPVKEGKTGAGDDYKSLKMRVAIDHNSDFRVDLFGMKSDEVEIVKFKNKMVEKKNIKWSERNKVEEGWQLSNLRAVGLGTEVQDSKSRGGLTYSMGFDAVDKIAKEFKEGDSIKVVGSLRFSEYTPQNSDRLVTICNYNIQKMFKINDIDFDAEEFTPYAKFDQTVVVAGSEKVSNYGTSEDQKALLIDGIIITDKNGGFVRQEFVVLADKREGLAKNINKLKDYSVLPLKGNLINKALMEVVEGEGSGDDWGADEEFDNEQATVAGYEKYFEVLAADVTKLEEKKYSDDDFVKDDILAEIDDDKDEDDEDIYADVDDAEDVADDWLNEE